MNDHIFEYLQGTKLNRYLENNDTLNLYPFLKEAIYKTRLFPESDVPTYMKHKTVTYGTGGTMNMRFSMKDECLSVFYSIIYDLNLSFIVCEIINTIVENEEPTNNEYIIMFLQAVKNNDYTSIDLILSNGFDMNIIGSGRRNMTYNNIVTKAYKMSNNGNMIRYLLSNGGDINNEYSHIGRNACLRGDIDLVNYLLDLDVSDDKLLSMFIASIENKNFMIADKIIGHGFKIEENYQRILDCWESHIDPETVKYLFHCGLDMNKYGSYLLRSACRQHNLKLIAFCLENNLTVDLKTLDIIFFCAELNIIEIFAKNYVDLSMVKFKDTRYDTLITSSQNNGLDMIPFLKYLLKRVDNINRECARFRKFMG